MDTVAALARLVQYLAVSAVGGSSLFFRYGFPPGAARWPRRLVRVAAVAGVLGVAGWLMRKAAEFGSGPADAFDPAQVWAVTWDTSFGRAALLRAVLLGAALALSLIPRHGRTPWTTLGVLGLAASATFAWTGHGAADDGRAGAIHLTADVFHLLSAAIWVGALLALSGLLVGLRRRDDPAAGRTAADALNSFSRIGVAVVVVIAGTGLVNSWFLVGPDGVASLLTSPYGQLLAAKLALFMLMLGLAAANRYRHTPRIEAGAQTGGASTPAVRAAVNSVVAETVAAGALLLLVAWLGTLAPPAHGP
ncbi:MAG: copD [Phenylobacterium sp.]|nr:copD [Phenylobacterium sp.]